MAKESKLVLFGAPKGWIPNPLKATEIPIVTTSGTYELAKATEGWTVINHSLVHDEDNWVLSLWVERGD